MDELATGEHRPHAVERGPHLGQTADPAVELAVPVGVLGRCDPERAPVLLAEVLDHRAHDAHALLVVHAAPAAGALDDALGRVPAEAQHLTVEDDDHVLGQRVLAVAQCVLDHLDHAHVALDLRDLGRVVGAHRVLRLQAGGGRELHVLLAERRQHLVDVAQEDRVRPDEQHPAVPEALPVRVEQVRGTVQRDGRLAGAGTTGDDEHTRDRRADRLVLLGLDGRDDVAHPSRARTLERGEQRALADDRQVRLVGCVAVEDLVVEADDHAPLPGTGEEVAPAHDVHRLDRGRAVEGLGDRCAPVDDDRVALLVGDGDAPDVVGAGRLAVAVPVAQVEPPEAERQVADVERGEAPAREVLGHVPLETGLVGAAPPHLGVAPGHPPGGLPHGVEEPVGVVDVALLRRQLGMTIGQGRLVDRRFGIWEPTIVPAVPCPRFQVAGPGRRTWIWGLRSGRAP